MDKTAHQRIRYLRTEDGVQLAWARFLADHFRIVRYDARGSRARSSWSWTRRNHVLLEGEPAWDRFCEALLDFVGLDPVRGEDPAFATLSPREREVLVLVSEGLSNAEIAHRPALQEKTVRNHVSGLFDKLGVWSRAQAIVFARDRGFQA